MSKMFLYFEANFPRDPGSRYPTFFQVSNTPYSVLRSGHTPCFPRCLIIRLDIDEGSPRASPSIIEMQFNKTKFKYLFLLTSIEASDKCMILPRLEARLEDARQCCVRDVSGTFSQNVTCVIMRNIPIEVLDCASK